MRAAPNPINFSLIFLLLRSLSLLLFAFSTSTFIFAEKLPLKFYTSADGLANDLVSEIVADSHGFLWFCTAEGLSRFDGYSFKNYTQEDGLPHREINSILETKDGTYLIATPKGLVVFNPLGKSYRWNIIDDKLEQNSSETPLFKTYLPNDIPDRPGSKSIYSIAQDGNGNIYAAAKYGLYRFIKTANDWQFQRITDPQLETDKVEYFGTLFSDSRGDVWLGVDWFVYRILKTGEFQKVSEPGSNGFFEDKDGNIWVNPGGHTYGIRVFSIQNNRPVLKNLYTKKDGLFSDGFSVPIAQDSKGNLFINSNGKLLEFISAAKDEELKFRSLEIENITTAINKDGAIWFAFGGNGAARYSPNSFYTFDKKDGLLDKFINWIFGNKNGDIFLTSGAQYLSRVSNGKIENLTIPNIKEKYWTNNFLDLQSQDGEFWLSSTNGLYRYPKISNFLDLNKISPKKVYTTADGLNTNVIGALFEDPRGDIWFSALTPKVSLMRLEKSTGKIYSYTPDDGLPNASGPVSFGVDAAGNVWIGFFFGQIVRYKDGKFRNFTDEGLIQTNSVNQFLSDKQGRLWLATSSRGLFYVDDPNAEKPVFNNFSIANGLSSNQTNCLVKDNFGSIYVGTGRGINRIEPDLQRIKIFTQNDGLPGNVISKCYADVNGNLWFSWLNSLIKFTPEAEKPSAPPPIFIGGISVNGKPQTVSELGEKEINNLEFASDERQIQISFFAISFDPGENLRYQYKINDQEWSEPNERRTVDFNLSPGTHNFAVRAITATGVLSQNSAKISMIIARPIWQRWWFIALMALLVGAAVFALDRYRVHKTRQVEIALEETKRANILIRESEIRFRTLADTASDAILTIDADSKIIFVNEAIEKVFGYFPDELIGQPMTMLMPERMRRGHDEGLTRYLSTNQKNINWEGVSLPGLHKKGHEIPLEVSFGEFEREGKRYFTGIARDVSERKRAEEALQKAREEKFKELQRVRTRIATDLHDDIGSSLTQIAVLTEVARGQANHLEAENLTVPLERIKGVSKELVSVMSDIVWAINPAKDNLPDLLQRMRRFGSDVLSGKGIKFEFYTPDVEKEPTLGANIRRELFAIFKEAVNNSAKYAECTETKVSFQIEDDWITLKIEDNGKGFDIKKVLSENFRPEMGGNGLVNIRRRAKDLGGTCEIQSQISKGTIIKLKIPLHLPETN
jgi:PAS domain S-box-containing protein